MNFRHDLWNLLMAYVTATIASMGFNVKHCSTYGLLSVSIDFNGKIIVVIN